MVKAIAIVAALIFVSGIVRIVGNYIIIGRLANVIRCNSERETQKLLPRVCSQPTQCLRHIGTVHDRG